MSHFYMKESNTEIRPHTDTHILFLLESPVGLGEAQSVGPGSTCIVVAHHSSFELSTLACTLEVRDELFSNVINLEKPELQVRWITI